MSNANEVVRASVVLKDWMGALRLTGPDTRSWLQGMVTNDVVKLPVGAGCYAGHLSAQGKLVAQLVILAEVEGLLLLVESAASQKLVAAFDRMIVMEDVQVQDLSSTHQLIELFGPGATAVLEAWVERPVEGLQTLYSTVALRGALVVRSELGFVLIVPKDSTAGVLEALVRAGAQRVQREAWEIVRVEAGIPLYGVDIDESTVFPELGGQGISYDKGCYIGQEVVARIKYLGHVNRRLVGFVCAGPVLPPVGSVVKREGKAVGALTSVVMSRRGTCPLALGIVSRTAAEPGMEVVLESEGASVAAKVSGLPFSLS